MAWPFLVGGVICLELNQTKRELPEKKEGDKQFFSLVVIIYIILYLVRGSDLSQKSGQKRCKQKKAARLSKSGDALKALAPKLCFGNKCQWPR